MKEELINELTRVIWNNFTAIPHNEKKHYQYSPNNLKKTISELINKRNIDIKNFPNQKEIIEIGLTIAKKYKLLNNEADIKSYLFGFIDGYKYTKENFK
jgi:hypothetical protein